MKNLNTKTKFKEMKKDKTDLSNNKAMTESFFSGSLRNSSNQTEAVVKSSSMVNVNNYQKKRLIKNENFHSSQGNIFTDSYKSNQLSSHIVLVKKPSDSIKNFTNIDQFDFIGSKPLQHKKHFLKQQYFYHDPLNTSVRTKSNTAAVSIEKKNPLNQSTSSISRQKIINDMYNTNPFQKTDQTKLTSIKTFNSNEASFSVNINFSNKRKIIENNENSNSQGNQLIAASAFGGRLKKEINKIDPVDELMNLSRLSLKDSTCADKITRIKREFSSAPVSPKKLSEDYKKSSLQNLLYNSIKDQPKSNCLSSNNYEKVMLIKRKFNSNKMKNTLIDNTAGNNFKNPVDKITLSKVPSKSYLVIEHPKFNSDHIKIQTNTKKLKTQSS